MKKLDPIELALERLANLRTESDLSLVAAELRKLLRDRSNLVVAKAAKIAGELRLADVVPELVAAFDRLMTNPVKLDKRCAATFELAAALHALDYVEPEIYRRGIRHVQKEASFGPPVDEAAKLRAQCALGLVRTNDPDALALVTDLLADAEPHARIGAIRALGACGGDAGALLLRYKALTGDKDPEVFAECLTALLGADFERSLPLIRVLVDSDDEERAGLAVLALGSQRRSEAFKVLREKWERTAYGDLRKTLLTAMAMIRLDEATEYLVGLVGDQSAQMAREVILALSVYHCDDKVRERLARQIQESENRQLQCVMQELWPERNGG